MRVHARYHAPILFVSVVAIGFVAACVGGDESPVRTLGNERSPTVAGSASTPEANSSPPVPDPTNASTQRTLLPANQYPVGARTFQDLPAGSVAELPVGEPLSMGDLVASFHDAGFIVSWLGGAHEPACTREPLVGADCGSTTIIFTLFDQVEVVHAIVSVYRDLDSLERDWVGIRGTDRILYRGPSPGFSPSLLGLDLLAGVSEPHVLQNLLFAVAISAEATEAQLAYTAFKEQELVKIFNATKRLP